MINQEIIDFANKLADLSTIIAKKYFRSAENGEVEKEDKSPVTKADQEIEVVIRAQIVAKFPEHGVIGEEYDDTNIYADYKWIIDPIDGTSSFIMGRPTFGTLIALSFRGKSILGIVNQPISDERWLGIDDGSNRSGAWLNGKKIKTRKCTKISNALMSTTSPYFFEINNSMDKLISKKYGEVVDIKALLIFVHLRVLIFLPLSQAPLRFDPSSIPSQRSSE